MSAAPPFYRSGSGGLEGGEGLLRSWRHRTGAGSSLALPSAKFSLLQGHMLSHTRGLGLLVRILGAMTRLD